MRVDCFSEVVVTGFIGKTSVETKVLSYCRSAIAGVVNERERVEMCAGRHLKIG